MTVTVIDRRRRTKAGRRRGLEVFPCVSSSPARAGTSVPRLPELLAAGHEVTGLASRGGRRGPGGRGRQSTPRHPRRLGQPAGRAAAADSVIHLAYNQGPMLACNLRTRPSSIWRRWRPWGPRSTAKKALRRHLGHAPPRARRAGRTGTETNTVGTGQPPRPRAASENATVALAGRGVRSSVIRLSPTVHGPADAHGFIPRIIAIARRRASRPTSATGPAARGGARTRRRAAVPAGPGSGPGRVAAARGRR